MRSSVLEIGNEGSIGGRNGGDCRNLKELEGVISSRVKIVDAIDEGLESESTRVDEWIRWSSIDTGRHLLSLYFAYLPARPPTSITSGMRRLLPI